MNECEGCIHNKKHPDMLEVMEYCKQRQERDKIKNQYALDNNIDLIRIPYWERDNITIDYILGNKFLIKENC